MPGALSFPKAKPGVALLMAGGKSERMRAGGCVTHKALRTIGGRTLLEQNLDTLFSYGFTEVAVAVNQTEQDLLTAVSELQPFAASRKAVLRVLKESLPLGTIGAAGMMALHTDDLLVLNVDNVTDLDLDMFFAHHLQSKAALTVACHNEPFRIPFGQLEVSESRVLACKEKPVIPVLVSSGVYALGKRAIAAIVPDQKTQAPDLMNSLIADGEPVAYFQHNSRWIDINDEHALAAAEAEFAQPLRARFASA